MLDRVDDYVEAFDLGIGCEHNYVDQSGNRDHDQRVHADCIPHGAIAAGVDCQHGENHRHQNVAQICKVTKGVKDPAE